MRGSLSFLAGTPIGHYRVAVATGLTAGLAANAPIISVRWGGTGFVRPLITRIELLGTIVTPFTGAQEITVAATIARSWSAADTGGTAITLTGVNNVQNSLADVASSATINAATTTALTPGTRTLDANPIMYATAAQTLAAASANPLSVYDIFELNSADSQFAFNLQNNVTPTVGGDSHPEGLVITVPVAQGAGGTVRYVLEMEWIEYGYGPGTVPGAIA